MGRALLSTKEKVFVHLSEFSRFCGEYEVPEEVSQGGIARAVGIRVEHVSQYVRPLVDEGLLEETLRHIRGGIRRRKAYFLTPNGQSKATALRTNLLERPVALQGKDGTVRSRPLSWFVREGRRGAPLLLFVRELEVKGFIDEAAALATPGFVDFSGGAPTAEQFYGREAELAELLQAVERAPVVVLTGVAGIGKTTLGSRACKALRGTRSLYWRRIRPWDTALDLAAGLASFLNAAGRSALSSYLATAESKQLGRIEELLAVDFADLKSLVVMDDVHTASREAEAFLHCLKEALCKVRGASVLLLSRTVPRFYGRQEVDLGGLVVELPLAGLDPESIKAFLAEIPRADVSWVTKIAGGNPLFLRILVRAGVTATMERARYAIERFIAEEIEAILTHEERACVQLASLYEMPVPPTGLLLTSPQGMTMVTRLQARGLVDRTDEGRLVVHDFLRHYFQSTLSLEAREHLVENAVKWLAEEARRAEGVHNVRGAIALLANAAMIDRERARRGGVLEELARLRWRVGDLPGAAEACREALGLVEESETRARLYLRLSFALYPFRNDEETDRAIEEGFGLLPPGPSLLAGWFLFNKARVLFNQGNFAGSLDAIDRAVSWVQKMPEGADLLGMLLDWRAIILVYDPARRDLSLAESDYRTSINALKKIRHWMLYKPYEGLALIAAERGRTEEALSYLDEAQTHFHAADILPISSNIAFLRAWVFAEGVGDYDAADALYHEAYDVAESASERYRLVWFDRFFADLYWHQGRLEEAKESLERFLHARGFMTDENEVQNLSRMARLCAQTGDHASANSYLEDAQQAARQNLSEAATYYVEWARAVLRTAQGDFAEARSSFDRALELKSPGRSGTHLQEHLASGAVRGEMLLDYAQLLVAEGHRDLSEAVMKEARTEFVSLGRMPLREIADRLLVARLELC